MCGCVDVHAGESPAFLWKVFVQHLHQLPAGAFKKKKEERIVFILEVTLKANKNVNSVEN